MKGAAVAGSRLTVQRSANNRLMYYETFDTSGSGQVLESTTYYFYNSNGNVTRVVTNEEGSNEYQATLLSYARNESTVTFVLGERWDWDGNPADDPTGYDIAYAREFRYDGARQRYLNRELDPNELRDNDLLVALNDVWSDYDGDEIYGDFAIDEDENLTYERWYEPGLARVIKTPYETVETEYYHGDLIGTTRDVSYKGYSTAPAVYSAFGELVSGTNHRYGYAGAYGYQTDNAFPFVHVGARYYDPGTGRFLQRDPIGIRSGTHLYAYVGNAPTVFVDPSGLGVIDWMKEVAGAVQQAVEDIFGTSSPAKAARAPIDVTARAMACAPDLARATIATDFRRKTVLNPDLDLDDGLDMYEQGHDEHVKPGSGPAG